MAHHHHGDQHGHHHGDRQGFEHDQAEHLDLDAEVFGAQLAAVLDLIGTSGPEHVVDLGAGTGTGSRLLRARYPDATVTAVDNSEAMLDRLRSQGFDAVAADLDEGFPALPQGVDLVWAASSLHHVADPSALLAGARAALRPGGTLVVVELDGLPRFLTGEAAALEERLHAAAAAAGWNHHPDWTPVIAAAGFSVTRTSLTTPASATEVARRSAQGGFTRFRNLPGLGADDLAALDDLLADFPADLEPRATRTVWMATPTSPQEERS